MGLVLNNLKLFTCHKTKLNQTKPKLRVGKYHWFTSRRMVWHKITPKIYYKVLLLTF